jgi:tRNA threonylcarbamoyladenosine biosynthesis protein TsaE
MQDTYTIVQPPDFQKIITDIFSSREEATDGPLIVTLTGDLGAGKTTFTQELGKALGIAERITSPTFTVMKQYELTHKEYDELFHIDAYRIEDVQELRPLHIEELFFKKRAIIVIEWPEHISSVIPTSALSLIIKINADNVREVVVQKNNK